MKTWLPALAMLGFLMRQNEPSTPDDCSPKDPVRELSWLRKLTQDTTYQFVRIDRATYQKRTVFQVSRYVGVDAGTQTIYSCNGATLCKGYITIAGLRSDCKVVFNQLTNVTTLYQRQKKR